MRNDIPYYTTSPLRDLVHEKIHNGELTTDYLYIWSQLEPEIGSGIKRLTNNRLGELFKCHPKTAAYKMQALVDQHIIIKLTTRRGHQTHNYYRINPKFVPSRGKNAPLSSRSLNINILDKEITTTTPRSEKSTLIRQAFPEITDLEFLDYAEAFAIDQLRKLIKLAHKKTDPAGYFYKTLRYHVKPMPTPEPDAYGQRFISGPDAAWIEH